MVAWGPAVRTAIKVAPVAVEVARQLDRQLRPHVLAYRAARDVDGYVGRWTDGDGTHWLVFAEPSADPLRAFPPLRKDEAAIAAREFDRRTLTHHSRLPEGKARDAAMKLRDVPVRATDRLRRRDEGDDGDAGVPALPPA